MRTIISHGPSIDLETYRRVTVRARQASRLPAELKQVRQEIAAVRAVRAARGTLGDSLRFGSQNLALRLAVRRAAAAERHAQAHRRSLLDAASLARRLGYQVRASKDRGGHISSYYVSQAGIRTFRVSDHAIPQTSVRDMKARLFGHDFFDGFPGPQVIIDRPRSGTWLRRALTLAAAGRSVVF